jgi:hypothetical protein
VPPRAAVIDRSDSDLHVGATRIPAAGDVSGWPHAPASGVALTVDQGISMPFEFVCLPCSSQGARVVLPLSGECPRCHDRTFARSPAQAHRELTTPQQPIGAWRIYQEGRWKERPEYRRRPGWAEQLLRRWIFGDMWIDI